MMKLRNLFLVVILGATGFACTRKPEPQPVRTTPEPIPVTVITPAPVGLSRTILANLEAFTPQVTVRRAEELVWGDALLNMPFYRYDSVKTHDEATAKILFQSGARIHMNERSLVIINNLNPTHSADRAVLRGGEITGKTPQELWLLTSAALIRLRSRKAGSLGAARLAMEEGKQFSVELTDGEGEMLQPPTGTRNSPLLTRLKLRKPVVLSAPIVSSTFGDKDSEPAWLENFDSRSVASIPSGNDPKPIEFFIESPANYSEVTEAFVILKGKVSRAGGKILVNGKPGTIDAKLRFNAKVPVSRGANTLVIQLIQPTGEITERQWLVVRK